MILMPEPKNKKTNENTAKFIQMVAKKQDWVLNPDAEFIEMLVEGLTTNFNRFGYYCCPCRDGEDDKAIDKDIMCPCDYCKPDQAEYGSTLR